MYHYAGLNHHNLLARYDITEMPSFVTATSVEERDYCFHLLPGVEWLETVKVTVNELDIDTDMKLWNLAAPLETTRCTKCAPGSRDREFQCKLCDLTFHCATICKGFQLPPSHRPTCVFLQLQREVACCASSAYVMTDETFVQHYYSSDYHPVSVTLIRELTQEARQLGIPWSLLVGTFHCVGGVCAVKHGDTWPVSPEVEQTREIAENIMLKMLQVGYDFAEPVSTTFCLNYSTNPDLYCYYPSLCHNALSRYAHQLEDAVSSNLLSRLAPATTVGFDVLPTVYSYLGLAADGAASRSSGLDGQTCTSVTERFKKRRLA